MSITFSENFQSGCDISLLVDVVGFTQAFLKRCGSVQRVSSYEECAPALAGLGLDPDEAVRLAGEVALTCISDAEESMMGEQVHERFSSYVSEDAGLDALGSRLAAASTRRLDWRFAAYESEGQQAQSFFGGLIYATRGIMQAFPMEAQLAFVLAHEIAHVEGRAHVANRGQKLLVGLVPACRDAWVRAQRAEEYRADRRAVELMRSCGYEGSAALSVLSSWDEEDDAHGPPDERLARLRELV